MKCPTCSHSRLKCLATRTQTHGVRRRYECPSCSDRITTIERRNDNDLQQRLKEVEKLLQQARKLCLNSSGFALDSDEHKKALFK